MTAGDNWKRRVKLERKEMNFWVLNKADSRRGSCISLFYSCVVQSANTKGTTVGRTWFVSSVRGVWGMVGAGRAEPGCCCPSLWSLRPCLRGQCPPNASTIPASCGGDRGSAHRWQRGWLPLHTLTQTPQEKRLSLVRNGVGL